MRKYLLILSLFILGACATDDTDSTPSAWVENVTYTVVDCNATVDDTESALYAALIAQFGSAYEAQISNLKVTGKINGNLDFEYLRSFKRLDLREVQIIGEFNISSTATDSGDATAKAVISDEAVGEGSENINDPEGGCAIPEEAFCYKETVDEDSSLVEIYMPSSVKAIGKSAFWRCTNLKNVYFEEDSELIRIHSGAFYGCNKLVKFGTYKGDGVEEFDLPATLTDIKDSSFRNCSSLDDVTLPDGLLVIGSQAFQGCSTLRSINIPSSVETLGSADGTNDSDIQHSSSWSGDTFRDCVSLTNITVNWAANAPQITDTTFPEQFRTSSWNRSIYIAADLTDDKETAYSDANKWSYYFLSTTENDQPTKSNTPVYAVIASTVTANEDGTNTSDLYDLMEDIFGENFDTTSEPYASLTITGSITSSDFQYMQTFKSINLKGVTSITRGVDESGNITTANVIPSRSFEDNDNLVTIYFPSAGLPTIGDYAFQNCSNLFNVYFIDTANSTYSEIQSIGNYAFYNCEKLTTAITMPNDSKDSGTYPLTIGTSAFENCYSLAGVTFMPKEFIYDFEIGASAFKGCSALTALDFPNSITEIGSGAFAGCNGLTSITTAWTTDWSNSTTATTAIVPNIDSTTFPSQFADDTGTYTVTFTTGNDGAYNGSTGWSYYGLADSDGVAIDKHVVYVLPTTSTSTTAQQLNSRLSNYVSNCQNSYGISLEDWVTIKSTYDAFSIADIQNLGDMPLAKVDLSQLEGQGIMSTIMNGFNNNTSLVEIKLDDMSSDLVALGNTGSGDIFSGCTNLKAIYLPWGADDVPAVDDTAFEFEKDEKGENQVTIYIPYGTTAAYEAKGWRDTIITNLKELKELEEDVEE